MKFRTPAFCLAALLCLPALAGAQLDASEEGNDDEEKILTKRIVVTARRLPDDGTDEDALPLNTTIITREQIEKSTARTVQELLAEYAGMIVYDNVGNGAESTVGMRGFSGGGAVAVFVDGVRVNEPFDNGVNLEFVNLRSVERIEIIPGGAGYSRGSGATAGTINLIMRGGEGPGWTTVRGGYGSFATVDAAAETGADLAGHRFHLSGRYVDGDGFRDNGQYDQRYFFGKYAVTPAESSDLELSARYYKGNMGNPGALTADELASDREQNPYNELDFADSDETVLAARYNQRFSDNLSASVLGSYRTSTIEVLTTGRSAALYGGFASESDSDGLSLTAQATYEGGGEFNPELTAGVDFYHDEFTNIAFYTDAAGNNTSQSNDRDTEQDTLAAYVQGSLTLGGLVTLHGAARYDSVEMAFTDDFNGLSDEADFNKTTGSAGVTVKLSEFGSVYGRYSQSFQTPTVNDLFAFPYFGSNPDLEPVEGETWEGGVRLHATPDFFIRAAVYRMNLENEIVFVITDPVYFIGSNENVGESRRTGIEIDAQAKPVEGFSLRASYAWTDAENLSDAETLGVDFLRIPQVPEHRFAAVARYEFDDWHVSWTAVYTGDQVMDSDNYNSGPLLAGYTVHNLSAGLDRRSWGARVDVRNLFDEEYSTRAIYSGISYFTPAPGINALATFMLRF